MSRYVFRPHDPPGICQRCGFKRHVSELRKEWTGLRVCFDTCWEPRNRQEFVKGVPDPQRVRGGTLPEPADVFAEPSGDLATLLFGNGEAGFLFYPMGDRNYLYTTSTGSTTVTSDGDPVGRIVDRAGLNNATQATTSLRPLWSQNSGKPCLSFDGVNDYLATSFVPTANVTLAAAFNVSANSATQTIIGGGNTNRATLSVDLNGYLRVGWGTTSVVGTIPGTGGHIAVVTGQGTNPTIYLDGLDVTSAFGAFSGGPNGSGFGFDVGASSTSGTATAFCAGTISAALVVNRKVTAAEASIVRWQFRDSF